MNQENENKKYFITIDLNSIVKNEENQTSSKLTYDPLKVECEYCGSIFDHSHLNSDGEEICGVYNSSDTICQVCGAWDCCEVEYESIENALNRKESIIESKNGNKSTQE